MRVKSSHVKSYDEIQGNRDSFDQVPFMVHHPLKYKSLMSWFDTFHKKKHLLRFAEFPLFSNYRRFAHSAILWAHLPGFAGFARWP